MIFRAQSARRCSIDSNYPPRAGRSREVLMNPIVVSRNESECVLIEGSINSVRISVKVKKADDLEDFLAKKFMRCGARHVPVPHVFSVYCRFLSQRAESFVVLRRKPIAVSVCSHDVMQQALCHVTLLQDYDISFLITNFHTESMYKSKVVDFVIDFIQVSACRRLVAMRCAAHELRAGRRQRNQRNEARCKLQRCACSLFAARNARSPRLTLLPCLAYLTLCFLALLLLPSFCCRPCRGV